MKRTICILFVLATRFAGAQVFPVNHEWTATLKVVDETGWPVTAAKASVGTGANFGISGLTAC